MLKTVIGTLSILVLLASLTACALLEETRYTSQKKITENNMRTVRVALMRYEADTGSLPSKSEGMDVLLENPNHEKWAGPYIKDKSYQDAWGQELVYDPTGAGKTFKVISAGPDKVIGTEDDIVLE